MKILLTFIITLFVANSMFGTATPTPTPTPGTLGTIPLGTDVVTYAGWHIVNGKLIMVPVATPTPTATATATATATPTP